MRPVCGAALGFLMGPKVNCERIDRQSGLIGAGARPGRVGSDDLRSIQSQQLAYLDARMNLIRVLTEQRVQRVNLHLALVRDFSA